MTHATLRILVVHNRYLMPGGEDESFAAEVALLRGQGHSVDTYVENNARIESLGKVRTALRTIWSLETFTAVRLLIRDEKYDLVSVQNWFPLVSPSVYYAARSMGVPVIQTLRNFRFMCVNGLFLRDGRVCELCRGRTLAWPGIRYACYRDSHVASAVVATTFALNRLVGTWSKVNAYVALNDFVRDKYAESGVPVERIVVKPNFLAEDPGRGDRSGGYAFLCGRLSREKGVDTAIESWKILGPDAPPLKIAGSGPAFPSLQRESEGLPAIEWLGQLPHADVIPRLQAARFLVFPSRWYENFPRIILEALACGVPVIASRLGAMAVLIRDGETGLLFEPDNPRDLAEKVRWLCDHAVERDAMAQASRQEYLNHYTAEANYRAFQRIWMYVRNESTGR